MSGWGEVMAWMYERCEACGCLLNNAPECEPSCAHTTSVADGPRKGGGCPSESGVSSERAGEG